MTAGESGNGIFAFLVILMAVAVSIFLGHEARQAAQLLVLAIPMIAWLLWPVDSVGLNRFRTVTVTLWVLGFSFDGAARQYLMASYGSAPEASVIIGASANTNVREALEYLSTNWRSLGISCMCVVGTLLLVGHFSSRGRRRTSTGLSRSKTILIMLLLLVSAVAYSSKPWRRNLPLIYWITWAGSVSTLRESWSDLDDVRRVSLQRAMAVAPVLNRSGPATVVLVIGESINRDNMSLYGYGRPTTPGLIAEKKVLGDSLMVVRNAWSVDASTLPALRNIFRFGMPSTENPQHLLALARAAGYKVWWLSNQDDIAIEQEHARLSNVFIMLNRKPGRSSTALDENLLDHLDVALRDAAPHKLIVVHMIGAHPHYALRIPPGTGPARAREDQVELDLVRKNRPIWLRRLRNQYDAAIQYHDFVVARSLQMTRRISSSDGYLAWMYLSDHGQEVGHESNRAGHSSTTAAGYRIPTLIWSNRPADLFASAKAERAFRGDWSGWTITNLLHLQWPGDRPDRNLLDDSYRWRFPELPVVRPVVERASLGMHYQVEMRSSE
ncbi:heptose-I-phosphate ethanolaminephosphotransferase [Variovorax sp. 54]|nr:heptose-I-phosphate ethanolaminephosphotransferase [Variovorax sp. 54]